MFINRNNTNNNNNKRGSKFSFPYIEIFDVFFKYSRFAVVDFIISNKIIPNTALEYLRDLTPPLKTIYHCLV